jgi:hypothetical protein
MSDNSNSSLGDLAAGAGGKYRYLIPEVDKSKSQKISKLVLWRFSKGNGPSTDRITSQGRTGDLNNDRRGDCCMLAGVIMSRSR